MGVKSNNIEKRSYFFDIQTRDDENEGIAPSPL